MTTDIQIFNNADFGNVRIIEEDGNFLFCGSDVAKALGYAKPNDAIARHCRATVKRSSPISGKMQDINFISEGDVYRLIVHSKLPSAEQFEKWVFDEVLPSIRKNGGYIAGQEELSPAELMAKALLVAQKTLADREARIESLTKENQLMKPKADVCDAISASEDSIPIKNFANILSQNGVKIGQNRLFTYFRENGYLINSPYSPRHNTPTQKAMDLKLFTVQERAVLNSGGARITYTSRLTPKGQQYFLNKFLNIA